MTAAQRAAVLVKGGGRSDSTYPLGAARLKVFFLLSRDG